uniref:Uncharacterized protein n=1 Tax=Arion vulgaris TaxID=1028688 RepID=A0A0B6ZU96_9EUPU
MKYLIEYIQNVLISTAQIIFWRSAISIQVSETCVKIDLANAVSSLIVVLHEMFLFVIEVSDDLKLLLFWGYSC